MATSGGSTDTITVPGGVKLFFNDGTGELDLGNIVGDSVSIARDTEELEHFTNRSGTRLKDKVITIEEAVQIDFALDEIVLNHMKFFFKGGTVATVGAGTAAIVDQKETLTAEIFASVEKPGLTAVSARQFVDYVRHDVLGTDATYLNHDTEADTVGGTVFNAPTATTSKWYIGKETQFGQVDFQLTVLGVYVGLTWQYWNGSAWTALAGTGGPAVALAADGLLTYTLPTDWAKTIVNGQNAYWIRVGAITTVTTVATVESVGRLTLTVNTDYTVDPGNASGAQVQQDGRLKRVPAGVLVSGEEIKTSFTHVTFASQTFPIAAVATIEGSARLQVTPSTGRGTTYHIIIPRAQLTNNGNMDLDDTEFQEIPMSLVVLDNSACDPTAPFGTVQIFA